MPEANTIDTNARAPLLLATTIATGTLAYADPVRFENDGSFEWSDRVFLDLTRPVSKQTGLNSGQGSFLYTRVLSGCCAPHENMLVTGATPDAQVEGYPAVSVRGLGAVVPDDFASSTGRVWNRAQPLGYYYFSGAGFYSQFDEPLTPDTPGDIGYMAARFDIDGQTHYGWMSLYITRHRPNLPTWVFHLVAWGYETDPDTPLPAGAVPAPGGALAALALGAVAGMTRGRRES